MFKQSVISMMVQNTILCPFAIYVNMGAEGADKYKIAKRLKIIYLNNYIYY